MNPDLEKKATSQESEDLILSFTKLFEHKNNQILPLGLYIISKSEPQRDAKRLSCGWDAGASRWAY